MNQLPHTVPNNSNEHDDVALEVTESSFRESTLATGQVLTESTRNRTTVRSGLMTAANPKQEKDFRGSARRDLLKAQTEEQHRLLQQQVDDQEFLKEEYDLFQKTGAKKHAIEIIIQDGFYTVTNPACASTSSDGDIDEMQKQEQRQHIETVGNANPCYQLAFGLANYVKRCIVNKGKMIQAKEPPSESKILENIHLKLESGQTYLLLGT